jgi:hypothetical protein
MQNIEPACGYELSENFTKSSNVCCHGNGLREIPIFQAENGVP